MEDVVTTRYDADDNEFIYGPGRTIGWAIAAAALGVAGAITILVLRGRATADEDGPLRKYRSNVTAARKVGETLLSLSLSLSCLVF